MTCLNKQKLNNDGRIKVVCENSIPCVGVRLNEMNIHLARGASHNWDHYPVAQHCRFLKCSHNCKMLWFESHSSICVQIFRNPSIICKSYHIFWWSNLQFYFLSACPTTAEHCRMTQHFSIVWVVSFSHCRKIITQMFPTKFYPKAICKNCMKKCF